jgi:hypothetical protein
MHHKEKEIAAGKYSIRQDNKSSYFWEKIRTWVLLFMGTVFAIYGTKSSIADIIQVYREELS